jgi:hypothetical protein
MYVKRPQRVIHDLPATTDTYCRTKVYIEERPPPGLDWET